MTIIEEIKKRSQASYRTWEIITAINDVALLLAQLEKAEHVMQIIDRQVEGGHLDPRSAIADARLKYSDPYSKRGDV